MPAPKGNQFAKGNSGGGRPLKYLPDYTDQAFKLCLLGATDIEIADFFDVAESTINNWKHEHEEFSVALKKGKALADANVANKLYQKATGYSHTDEKIFNNNGEAMRVETVKHYPPDTTACIYWLNNRTRRNNQSWSNKIQQEIQDSHYSRYSHMTDEELTAELDRLNKEQGVKIISIDEYEQLTN